MLRFTLQRLLTGIPTLLVLIALAFFLIRSAPGGPFDTERQLPPEIEANMRRAYHLDEPLVQQFGRYLGNLARGDFGPSFQYREFTVTELIGAGFPVSLRVGGLAMLPAGGYGDGGWRHILLPVLTLALPQIAYLSRLTRASMIEVLRSPYIRTARAQGLPLRTIILRHALKPALLPVVSYLGPATAALITGSVVIEQIFGLPGIGRFFVTGALNRDYTLVMGVVVFYGTLILVFNFLVDLVYGFLDPRIRHNA